MPANIRWMAIGGQLLVGHGGLGYLLLGRIGVLAVAVRPAAVWFRWPVARNDQKAP